MKDIALRTLSEHILSLKSKDYSSRELTLAYLERIDAERELNAYITVCAEQALAAADAADRRAKNGERLSVLDGIPYAAKDNIAAKGISLTCASKMLENFVPPYNATVMEKLEKEDALISSVFKSESG